MGDCVCTSVALRQIGPLATYAESVGPVAFSGNKAYWAEYHFVPGAPFSTIISGPIGKSGKVLINGVEGSVSQLRVTSDTIYVHGNEVTAYSLDGTALDAPAAETAFPPVTAKVKSTDMGLFVGNTKVASRAWEYAETATGVYYIPYDGADSIAYIGYDDPNSYVVVASVSDVYGGGGFGPVFNNLWVDGTNLGTDAVLADRMTHVLSYSDLSVLGH